VCKTEEATNGLLIQEFQQAWEHYRHIENERLWYVYFWFLVVLGAGGFAATIVGQGSYDAHPIRARVMLLLIGMGLYVVTVFTYIAVARLAVILDHYEWVWSQLLRSYFYTGERREMVSKLNVRETGKIAKQDHPIFSVQKNTEEILLWSGVIVFIVLTLATIGILYEACA
jgi:hypothetical protein